MSLNFGSGERDMFVAAAASVRKAIVKCAGLSETDRIAIYNAATSALAELVRDLCADPVLAIKLIKTESVVANDYNPNRVASTELDLLEHSIRSDGMTMPIVVALDQESNQYVTIDGFHRGLISRERIKSRYIPVTVLKRCRRERIASTIRHNRARGKHQVDMMAEIVRNLLALEWDDSEIATHIGMTPEELLRLKQSIGVAKLLAGTEYSCSWGDADGKPKDPA